MKLDQLVLQGCRDYLDQNSGTESEDASVDLKVVPKKTPGNVQDVKTILHFITKFSLNKQTSPYY